MTNKKEINEAIAMGIHLLGEMEQKMGYIHDIAVDLVHDNEDKFTDEIIDCDEKGLKIRDDFAPYLATNDAYIDFIYIDTESGHVRCFCEDWDKPLSDFILNGDIVYILEGLQDELNARNYDNTED